MQHDEFAKERSIDLSFYRDWVSKREQARQADAKKATHFVTISREFGCLGYDVATGLIARIEKETGEKWSLFTRKMLEEMAASAEFDKDNVHEIAETRWSFKDWFVDALVPSYLKSQQTKVFERMRNIILNLADKGHCVILGGGSQIITHKLDPKKFEGLHFRVTASYEWRLHRMIELNKCDRSEAESLIRGNQANRDQFIRDFTGLSASDPFLYHVIFNNGKNDTEMMVDIAYHYLAKKGAFKA
ncbi:MAG: cytidylate kinase-like family protein [Nitrospinae bacterium]|nr:cytidylate kinase-like family protein [Nitrospinota bacterium]